MAIYLDTDLQITVKSEHTAQHLETVWSYTVAATPVGVGVSAPALAEAWWNHVKGVYRAISPVALGNFFRTIEVRVVNNPAGDFGEWDVPAGEQIGTRANPTQAELLPAFNAAGVRLLVGTRATRPGQKRFSTLCEGDQANSLLGASIATPLHALMTLMTGDLGPLGAPAATFLLVPKIFRLGAFESVLASQRVTGYLINNYVTSQVSRKVGHGV